MPPKGPPPHLFQQNPDGSERHTRLPRQDIGPPPVPPEMAGESTSAAAPVESTSEAAPAAPGRAGGSPGAQQEIDNLLELRRAALLSLSSDIECVHTFNLRLAALWGCGYGEVREIVFRADIQRNGARHAEDLAETEALLQELANAHCKDDVGTAAMMSTILTSEKQVDIEAIIAYTCDIFGEAWSIERAETRDE